MRSKTYKFEPKQDQIVIVSFLEHPEIIEHKSEVTTRTYCTISVYEPNREILHYHGATVCNPKDHYNERTGMFIAFKKALKERYWTYLSDNDWIPFERYHLKWSHFLSALMDEKVTEDDNNIL